MVALGGKAEALRQNLQTWAKRALVDLGPVEIVRIAPALGGASSETYLIDVRAGGSRAMRGWVLRVEPRRRQIYEDASIARQYAVIEGLNVDPNLPIPAPIALERDDGVIGAPFFLMERARGIAPPSEYHSEGLFLAATPAERAAMWRSSVELLARLHAVDPARFAFLAWPGGPVGSAGIDQELARWDSYWAWSRVPVLPIYDRVRQWLVDFRPASTGIGFAWGDARLSNILFDRAAPSALLDWETASLGGAETDLGWWLFYDRMISGAVGVARLAGLGDASQTLVLWEELSGRKVRDIEWHVVFAGYRFVLISERARALAIAAGQLPADQWGPANPAVPLLERIVAEHA